MKKLILGRLKYFKIFFVNPGEEGLWWEVGGPGGRERRWLGRSEPMEGVSKASSDLNQSLFYFLSVVFAEFSKKCAERWKAMNDKEKKRFYDMAEQVSLTRWCLCRCTVLRPWQL